MSMMLQEKVVCLLFRRSESTENQAVMKMAEACLRFTPQIAVREGEAVFLDMTGSQKLFRDEYLLLKIQSIARRFGASPRIAIAEDASTALAAARFARNDKKQFPLEALYDYASPFDRNEDFLHQAERMFTVLTSLGVRTLGDFLKLPPKTLASRFRAKGVEISMRVQGSIPLAWPVFRFPETICEKIELHESAEIAPCHELEPLLFIVKTLSDRVLARLHGRGQRLSIFELELETDHFIPQDRKRLWRFELPVPQGSVTGLISILRDRLQHELQKKPLESAVMSLAFQVTESVPGHAAQKNLFHNHEEEAEAMDAFIGRLCQKLGKESAFAAKQIDRHLPERSWTRSVNFTSGSETPTFDFEVPPRPARILKRPVALQKEGEILFRESKQWRVMEWYGPERISCEWWRDPELHGFNRDYYRVVTDSGEELWVFSVPGRPDFYLHGYFD